MNEMADNKIVEHHEDAQVSFEGTVIDLETIGKFRRGYDDSRCYADIKPVIFGYISKDSLGIRYIKDEEDLPLFRKEIKGLLASLDRPFYGFNSIFEMGVIYNFIGQEVIFEREINQERFEKKEYTVNDLGIPSYDDPFHGDGLACMKAWLNGDVDESVKHNRSCLLKERDILQKRGHRQPDTMSFIKAEMR